MSTNEELLDEFVRHAIVFERFKKNESMEVAKFLFNEVLPDLRAKIEGGIQDLASRGLQKTATLKRLEALEKRIRASVGTAFAGYGNDLEIAFAALGISESEFAAKALSQAVPISDFDFKTISPEFSRAIVSDFPISGRTLKQRFEDLGTSLSDKAMSEVRIGLAQGETTAQIIGRLSNKGLAATKNQAQAIVRTAVNHVTTAAREKTFAENTDVIKAVQIVATLDSRTTEICMNYDGKVFPVNEGPRPPFHFNCRTTTIPVTKGWDELKPGLQAKTPQGRRASMTGTVPAKLTYGDWLKKQSKAIQDETLGPARAELFRQGKIGIPDLIGKFGKPLTLQQLQKKLQVTQTPAPGRVAPPIVEGPRNFPRPLIDTDPPPPPTAVAPPVMVGVSEDWPVELQTWLVNAVDAKLKGKPAKASYWKNKGITLGLPKKFKTPNSFEELNEILAKPFADIATKQVITDFDKLEEVFGQFIAADGSAKKSYYKTQAKKLGYTGEMPTTAEDISALIPPLRKGANPSSVGKINLPSSQKKLFDIAIAYGKADTPQKKSYWKKKAKELGYTGPLEGGGFDVLEAIEAWKPADIPIGKPPADIPGFDAPKKLSLPAIQYDEISQGAVDLLASPTGWAELSDNAKDTLQKLAAAQKAEDMVRIVQDAFPGKFNEIDFPRTLDPRMMRTFLSRHVEIYDGMPNFVEVDGARIPQMGKADFRTRVKNAYGWVKTSGREMGFPSQYWSQAKFDATEYGQNLHFNDALASGRLPFKSTGNGHLHTVVHEIGHTLDGMAYAPPLDAPLQARLRYREVRPAQYSAFSDAAKKFRADQRVRRPGDDWRLSGYAKTDPSEAWAEAFARMTLQDPDEWDDITRLAYDLIVAEHQQKNIPMPAFLRKKTASKAPEGYLDVSKWNKIGNQKGSNEGGLYVNPETGEKFYVKFYNDADHVDNEIVANRLYREVGLNTTKVHHGYSDGRYAVVSEWQEGLQQIDFNSTDVWNKTRAVEGFATDAWLANWDVAGASFDNLLAQGGGPIRVDAGGSLLFRAQGKPKGSLFGDEVAELATLRNSAQAPQAAKVYSQMGDLDVVQSISFVENITDERIDAIVDLYWRGGSPDLKDELKRKLKTRRNNLLKQRDSLLEKAEADFKLALKAREAREKGVLLTPEQYEAVQKDWINSLSSDEKEAIGNFTGSFYSEMKRWQRGEYKDAPDYIIRAATRMTQALDRAPSFQGDLYRGLSASGSESWFLPFLQEGGNVRIRDLTSTSYERGTQFSGNVQLYFEKTTRSGARVNEISRFKNREYEVVLRPDSEYRVAEVIELSYDYTDWANLPQWAKNQVDKLTSGEPRRWLIRLVEL